MKEFYRVKALELYNSGDEAIKEEIEKFFIYNIQYIYDLEVIILGRVIYERPSFLEEINRKMNKGLLIMMYL